MKNAEVTLDFIKHMFIELEILNITEVLITYNRSKFDDMKPFCLFLKSFSYPCKCSDLVSGNGWPIPELFADRVPRSFSHFSSACSQTMFTVILTICYMILIGPGRRLYCYRNMAKRYMKKEHP